MSMPVLTLPKHPSSPYALAAGVGQRQSPQLAVISARQARLYPVRCNFKLMHTGAAPG